MENINIQYNWKQLENKKRIVVKVGSSTLTHRETGNINYERLEKLVRTLSDLKNSGKDVILVSSGAIAVGREKLKIGTKPKTMAQKQACAAIGQCNLMMNYNKLFSQYGQIASQVLITKYSVKAEESYLNVKNTFDELLKYGSIPIVNENDAVATDEIEFGENDTLSAIVASVTKADLLIILTDTDGLFTDDPFKNKSAKLIETVNEKNNEIYSMAKRTSDSDVGTGGMYTKVCAAKIVNKLGIDMIIANGKEPKIINKIIRGEKIGTLFVANKKQEQNTRKYIVSQVNK